MKIHMGVVLLVAVLGTVQAVSTQDNCDFADVDAEQMAQNVLRKLPYSYTNPDVRPEELFLGITLGAPEIKGANIFKIYGPVSSYCRNGDRFVQVDIVADNPVDYFAPWKICNGKEGVIGAQGTARFTVTFEVANATAQDKCDFSDVDAEQMVENVLRKLPYSYTVADMKPEEIFLGITLDPFQLQGANIFKLYGPVSSYCRDGARLVQVDIVADRPVDFFAPWKICSGKEGVMGQCDFSKINAEQMVRNIVGKLPSSYTDPEMRPEEIFLGITLGVPVLKGADIFKLYGPVSTYCRNGARLVQVDIVADYPIDFSAPWKICSGKKGVVGIHGTARVTVTFEVTHD
ncbi:hypothetical protein MTO96_050971 [Rhipicephalus appendiculatus]